uniref:Putative conserved plasma membrane protein n=1 Tax=Corethrella appendiculata TaxID=1370023 RepID=U5EPU8_9DIPT
MANSNPAIYAAGVTCLGFICFALSATAVGLPIWAYFESGYGSSWDSDRGYFGPWRVCKQLNYNREKCGFEVSRFRPSQTVYFSGLIAVIGCSCLGLFCILCILQIAMISSRDKICIKYNVLVMLKLILSLLGTLLALLAAILFSIQTDDVRTGYRITRGVSFYLQILVIVLTLGLFVMAIYDVIFSRRTGGDPTMTPDISQTHSTTYNNPGFRDGGSRSNNGRSGISVTDSSGKPYQGINGSMQSMNTTLTTMSNGSTISSLTKTPLRSSLKKPKSRDGFSNPGFSGHSPTMQRNGSVKKVRIQTHSTEV